MPDGLKGQRDISSGQCPGNLCVIYNNRPARAKALPNHSFALAGRIHPFPTTLGVALGLEQVTLSGRFNHTFGIFHYNEFIGI